jgi:diguanylate cyclase (GGDEF)-like protein
MVRSWGELLRRELRIDKEDTRTEMVRVSVIAYLGCVVTGLLSLSVSRWSATSPWGSLVVIAVAALTMVLLWVFKRRVPLWVLIMQAPYAALLLAIALWVVDPGTASTFPLFYVLLVLYGTFFLRPGAVAVLIVFCSLCFASVVIAAGEPDWAPRVIVMFGVSVTIGLFAGLLVKHVHERAVRDSLTGLINRRMWEYLVQMELDKSARDARPVSIMLIDVDDFKEINDRFGHLYGDDVLKRVADTLRRILRKVDAPCRWGGDEFAVLLTECGADKSRSVADRLREEVGDSLSLSIGTATARGRQSLDVLFQQADRDLYRSKPPSGRTGTNAAS